MSEYQYYEFRAVDRRLTNDEMQALRQISSRATITPISFVNTYNYGDFRGNPLELMERYFDLHIYMANWGTRVLMIRVPSSMLNADVAGEYAPDMPVIARSHGGYTILEVQSDDEDERYWEEGEGWIDRLAGIRDELISGDLRPLYLSWLLLAVWEEPESEEIEPPVPPGLGQLSEAQQSLAEFLRVDPVMIEVAAERSTPLQESAPLDDEMRAWVADLPPAEKDALLVQAMLGDDALLGARLLKDFRSSRSSPARGSTSTSHRRRTNELFAAWQKKRAEIQQARQEREAREHAARMQEIAARAEALWHEADSLADERNAKSYNDAIDRLNELHQAAKHFGTLDDFQRRLDILRATHSRKSSFVSLLDSVGKPKLNSLLHSWKSDRS